MPVGVIGLGKVGTGIAKNLLEAGYDVVGYDLDDAARDEAEQLGVRIAANNDEVAAAASVIILSLPHPDASRAVVDAIADRGQPGTDVFDTSTLSAATARELHEIAQSADIHYFDSPITGGAIGAHAGELTIMIGGDVDRIEDRLEVLSAIADNVYHIGDVGDGQFVKLVHNHVGQTTLVILIEALLLGDAFGVDPATLYRTLRHYTQIYDDKLDTVFSNLFSDEFMDHFALDDDGDGYGNRFDLGAAHKDLMELRSLADEYDSYLPLGNFVEEFHRQGMNAGLGGRNQIALVEMYEELFDRNIDTTEDAREKSTGRLL